MADRKILNFTDAGTLTGAELVPVCKTANTDNFKTTTQAIANLAGGAKPTLVFSLPSSAGSFDGTVFTNWGVATVIQASADAHFNDTTNSIVFDTAGTYRVMVRGRINTDAGWPSNDVIVYGAKLDSNFIAQYGRVDPSGIGGGFTPDFVVFTGDDVIVATAAMSVLVGMFADAYISSATARFLALISVQRISP